MKNLMKNVKNRKGFTLIELIVVIAILAILAAIAIPRLAGFTESARQSSDKESAALLANAAAMYVASHADDTVPLTDAALTLAVLQDAGLFLAADLVTESAGYAADLNDAALVYTPATRTVTVTLTATAGTGATTYVVIK